MGRDYLNPETRRRFGDLSTGELDWVLLETTFWAAAGEDMEACATLLISCARAPNICGALAVPIDNGAQMLGKYGRGAFRPDMNWKEACATSSGIDFAVLYVDERSTLPLEEIGQLIQSLKSAGAVSVAVACPDLTTRRMISGADAFLIGSTETTVRTAGMLAQLICNVVQSPLTANCVDAFDLQMTLCGTAEVPCVLAEAIWRWKRPSSGPSTRTGTIRVNAPPAPR